LRFGITVHAVTIIVTARIEINDNTVYHIWKDAVSFPILAFDCFSVSYKTLPVLALSQVLLHLSSLVVIFAGLDLL
jgi:hypothetical protein